MTPKSLATPSSPVSSSASNSASGPVSGSTSVDNNSGTPQTLTATPGQDAPKNTAAPKDGVLNSATATATALPSDASDAAKLTQLFSHELSNEVQNSRNSVQAVARRIALEVERICEKSDRIQASGDVVTWQLALGRHRLDKCLLYYRLGSRQGRAELHSTLSTMVYRHVAPLKKNLGYQGRHTLIEDFLQGFYIEALKMFRRENELPFDYTPKSRLELAEYMAFTEQYAKRRVNLPGRSNLQIIVLRAQSFSNRQPQETLVDIETALDSPKREDGDLMNRSPVAKQLREQLVSEATDPAEAVLRDRVLQELIEYLRSEGHEDCIDYLTLRLQDLSAPEIDSVLGLTSRQRDYLQQRFKYHVERFSRLHNWELVHNWLGADVTQNLGLSFQQWEHFYGQLTPEQQRLVDLKREQSRREQERSSTPFLDTDIAKQINCTPKQVQKRWAKVLELAWQARNEDVEK
jgi:hypothetical protein